MVTVIIVGIVILSLVLLGWTWVSLGNIEKQKKILKDFELVAICSILKIDINKLKKIVEE